MILISPSQVCFAQDYTGQVTPPCDSLDPGAFGLFSLPHPAEEGRDRATSSQGQLTTPSMPKSATCISLLIHQSHVTTKGGFVLYYSTKQTLMILWKLPKHNRWVQYKTTACKVIKIHWFTIGFCLKVAQVLYKTVQTRLLPLSGLFAWVFLSFYSTGSTESFFKEKVVKS